MTRTSLNQGVLCSTGFVNQENINPAGTWSLGLLQMDFFYRNKPWYAGQFVRKITPKISISSGTRMFFQALLNMLKHKLLHVLVRNVDDTFRNSTISIPINNDGGIDFKFMEGFVHELVEMRMRKLEAYLSATGLKDYILTASDHSAIEEFNDFRWGQFRMQDLFERIKTKKLPYKAKDLPSEPQGSNILPCLTSSFMNQGLNYYAPINGATILRNVISIPSNSDVYRAYYQSNDFTVLSDAYAIRWKDESVQLNSKQYLFLVASINKVTDLPVFSYKNKLGGWHVVKNKYITLPVNESGQPDLQKMEALVGALQKIVIKDVAKYTERNLETTRGVVNKEVDSPAKKKVYPIFPNYRPGYIPIYSLRAACGRFENDEVPEVEGWIDASGLSFSPDKDKHFVIYAKGDSMIPKIHDGDLCVFEWYKSGSREGEIVLTQSSDYDPDYDGKYTIKRYHSEKLISDDNWQHTKIHLFPLNPEYNPIELAADDEGEYRTIGVFKSVL